LKILANRSKTTGEIAYLDRKFATHIKLAEGSLGQVTTKKKQKKMGITRPRPHSGVMKTQEKPRGH